MAAHPSSDIETRALLEGINNINSTRTSAQLGLITNAQQNAESLRASLLDGFKAVNAIYNHSQNKDKNLVRKSITRLFNKNSTTTAVHAAAIQEAFALMHRELTNVFAATGNNRKNLDDTVIVQKVADIIRMGTEKLPKGTLPKDLKMHVDIFQNKARECLKSQIPAHKQQNR